MKKVILALFLLLLMPSAWADKGKVTYRIKGCDYFMAEVGAWYYVLQQYGGYDPSVDDVFAMSSGYGFKDVIYTNGREGRLYVDNYYGSKSSAAEKLIDRCD